MIILCFLIHNSNTDIQPIKGDITNEAKQFKKFALILSSAFLLQGCVTATVAGIAGATAVATKVATDPRTVGTQIDDETLEEKVLYAINQDQQLKAEARINVISYNGRILLIGQVPNEHLKNIATSLVNGVNHVIETYNELRIGSKISLAQISQDSWITTQIKSKLFISNQVKSSDVKVITENGEVFLMGNLTKQQASSAAEIARNISGVKKVIKVFNYLD